MFVFLVWPGLIECNGTCRLLPARRPCESRLAMGRYCHHHCVCKSPCCSPSHRHFPSPSPLCWCFVTYQFLPFQVHKMVQELFPYLLSICEIEQERKETSGMSFSSGSFCFSPFVDDVPFVVSSPPFQTPPFQSPRCNGHCCHWIFRALYITFCLKKKTALADWICSTRILLVFFNLVFRGTNSCHVTIVCTLLSSLYFTVS